MNRTHALLVALLILTPNAGAASRTKAVAQGIGVNLSIIGRLIGGGTPLFVTSVDIANNTAAASQIDFYFDATDLTRVTPEL
jgi:hypothetical protein